jgi:hypothetical protein
MEKKLHEYVAAVKASFAARKINILREREVSKIFYTMYIEKGGFTGVVHITLNLVFSVCELRIIQIFTNEELLEVTALLNESAFRK